ncbi:hypothetical protein GGR34_001749 [Microvirga flocculans]|uniref:Uncharacterized protein n=1 Tax=Microvirga flocculans TaxID=217168 RepID=A0A7W6N865_9HYPH|nr:hypothetical protein [Microvirga flocculans]MBB4040098.1 hypothetical protein [Microvirga flocculans]
MLTKAELDAPAHLQYEPIGTKAGQGHPSDIREFSTLREAVHWAMNNEAPAGMEAVIRAASGAVLGPRQLEEIWSSLQGP